MDTEKRFFVGDVVEIFFSNAGIKRWIGFRAKVLPWPEEEEQYVDGLLHNWLQPLSERPDGLGMSPFMWATQNLRKVG
jgi:hypothetical protein